MDNNDKRDIRVEHHDDCTIVFLLSEDARAWAEENCPTTGCGRFLKLPGDGAATLEAMREDGLT